MGGSSSKPPPPPDYAEQYKKGIVTDASTLGARRELEFAAAQGGVGTTWIDGKPLTYNFTGRGDADFARIRANADSVSATANAENMLALQRRFGGDFIAESRKQLQMSDPIGFALREAMGKRVQTNLDLGGSMSDSERRGVQQSVRAAQTRSGNSFGVAAGVNEVMAQTDYSRNLERSRLSDASAFLSGQQPNAQFGQLRNSAIGSAPFLPTTPTPGTQLNPNAGATAAGFAQNIYSTQSQNYATNVNKPNPWMQAAGIVVGAAATYFSAGLAGASVAGALKAAAVTGAAGSYNAFAGGND